MEVIKRLGKGACGTVELVSVTDARSKKKVILAAKSSKDPISISDLRREKKLLKIFSGCPEIVQCHGWWYSNKYDLCKNGDTDDDDEDTTSWWYYDDHASDSEEEQWSSDVDDEELSSDDEQEEAAPPMIYSIFLEYIPRGSLAGLIKNSPGGKLPERQVRQYTKSILRGLAVIHGKGYVHCDVKPLNILVVSDEDAKIADFGLAKRSRKKDGVLRGTFQYIAPEGMRAEYGPPADVWSLGCTVLEMMTGRRPRKFPAGILRSEMMLQIARNKTPPEIPEDFSPEAKDFLSKCLAKNPKKRWDVEMLLRHPFVAHDHQQCTLAEELSSRIANIKLPQVNLSPEPVKPQVQLSLEPAKPQVNLSPEQENPQVNLSPEPVKLQVHMSPEPAKPLAQSSAEPVKSQVHSLPEPAEDFWSWFSEERLEQELSSLFAICEKAARTFLEENFY